MDAVAEIRGEMEKGREANIPHHTCGTLPKAGGGWVASYFRATTRRLLGFRVLALHGVTVSAKFRSK